MRVTTGEAKGRRLLSLPGEDTRPTSDMLKQALFNSVQFEVCGRRVLDLFAGTGQLGIEALSRGAKSCVFVENSGKAAAIIKKNIEATGFSSRGRVLIDDAVHFAFRIKPGDAFGLVLMDPPYGKGLARAALDVLAKGGALTRDAIIAVECSPDELDGLSVPGLLMRKQAIHGRAALAVFTVG